MVAIEVFGPERSQKILALVDSGADCSLFNAEIAEVLGINLSSAKGVNFTGISGKLDGCRIEEIEIKVDGCDKKIKIPACFVKSPSVGILLGQEGFFDQHRIKFEKDHDTFEIISVEK